MEEVFCRGGFHKRAMLGKSSCYGDGLIGGVVALLIVFGPDELWIAGLTALVIHFHFKRVPVYMTG